MSTSGPGGVTDVGGYRIIRSLGHGGMGSVYLAEHGHLKRQAAVKVLSSRLLDDATFRSRFMREYEIVAALEHPNIVPIYDAGVVDSMPYIAMRYIGGGDLAERIRDGKMPFSEALVAIRDIAAALDAVHARGIVHRDVKPANVLIGHTIDGRRQFYLGDFGISKRLDTESSLTGTGQLVGTVNFIAPEQVEGRSISHRVDVYSLAAMAYLLLTGEHVFPRSSDIATLWAHVRDQPLLPSRVRNDLPRGVDRALLRSLEKEPDRRHPSCGALALDLSNALLPFMHHDGATMTEPGNRAMYDAVSSHVPTRTEAPSSPGRLALISLTLLYFVIGELSSVWLHRWVGFSIAFGISVVVAGISWIVSRAKSRRN